ncbi:MAG: hypothetical protein DCC55_11395 [Chloroflexi bacterium]|nr:MAG: hypothetical protein DCC55_11395 [Chloroflexota bacterium]
MASSTPNIIFLESNGALPPAIHERPAGATVTPGDLLTLASTGKVSPLASAGGVNARIFALENPYAPDPMQKSLGQTYATDDYVRFVFARPGDLVYARLAASQTVVVGDVLIASATGGCLAKATVDATTLEGAIVAIAEEAVTTTGSVGRIKVRVI